METGETGKETITVRRSQILTVIGAVVMVSFFIFASQAVFANTGTVQSNTYVSAPAAGPSAPIQEGKQVVALSIQGSTYNPNPIRLKKGVPVVFEVDTNSVRGCFRGIQIPAFGVRKTVSDSDNKIEFVPDKAGTFGFSCFMGMGKGQIIVEDENGNVPTNINTVAQDIPKGGACGAGGGCGCGGR